MPSKKLLIFFSASSVVLNLLAVFIYTKWMLASILFANFTASLKGLLVSSEKSVAKIKLSTLKFGISCLITSTGISEYLTTFSLLLPINISLNPVAPWDPIIIR